MITGRGVGSGLCKHRLYTDVRVYGIRQRYRGLLHSAELVLTASAGRYLQTLPQSGEKISLDLILIR